MSPRELEVSLEGASVAELRDWASLWGDLLHVDMVLLAREDVPHMASNVFVRRALWESAVISYGRTAISGRRKQQVEELLVLLGADAKAFHANLMSWRNQHVAHRVDRSREQAEARAIVDLNGSRIKAVRVRISPILGPEDEGDDMAIRFKKYVEELRHLAWTQRIQPLEKKAIDDHSTDLAALIASARPPAVVEDDGFSFDIDPSGGSG